MNSIHKERSEKALEQLQTLAGNSEDAPKTFDLLGSQKKQLFWIEGATRRFQDGYNHFGRYPETVLHFLDQHLSSASP